MLIHQGYHRADHRRSLRIGDSPADGGATGKQCGVYRLRRRAGRADPRYQQRPVDAIGDPEVKIAGRQHIQRIVPRSIGHRQVVLPAAGIGGADPGHQRAALVVQHLAAYGAAGQQFHWNRAARSCHSHDLVGGG